MQVPATALGHGPALAADAVEDRVERAVMRGVAGAAAAGQCIVGREDAADEGDQRKPAAAVLAQGIDIPPDIAVRCYRLVEARSASTQAAAIRPERAAIGTPGPGCVLPPAR